MEALDGVEHEFHMQLLPPAVELAETHAVGTFRRKLNALVDTVRATTLTERHERALADRHVAIEKRDHGMSFLGVFLPTVEARAAFARATAMAKAMMKAAGEDRTLDQLRADIIGDLLIDGHTDVFPAETRGIRATVVVTVPALALLSGEVAQDPAIATVEGIGPVPFDRARELCGGAKDWMRVLTHPETGMVLSVGRDRYEPPRGCRPVDVADRATISGRTRAHGSRLPDP